MRRNKIPTLIAIPVLVLGLVVGVYLVQTQQIFRPEALEEATPENVRVANLTESVFSVSWSTSRDSSGFVEWGESEGSLNRVANDELSDSKLTHSVTISGLSPETSYFFEISSNGKAYNENGGPWQVFTAPPLAEAGETRLVSGSVVSKAGTPIPNVLVYVSSGGSSILSTVTSDTGGWVVPISYLRTQDLSSYKSLDREDEIQIETDAGGSQVASALILFSASETTPPIILGQDHDFRNILPVSEGDLPRSSLTLPQDSTPSSKFEIPEEEKDGVSLESVTLESVDEGEVITSTDPEFFGKGPPGVTITVTVESTPVSTEVKIAGSGEWSWDPLGELSEGSHKITITWRDADGILRTLSRSFVVSAAEGPAFESTPSATPKGTATPSPSPTLKPTGSPTPSATLTATPSATTQPESGSLTPTLLLSIMGLGVIALSFVVWKKAER